MPTADCPTVELQRREVFGKAFTVDIVVVVSRTQCRSISRYFKSHGRIRLNLSQSDSLPDSLASHLQVTCLSCLRQSYHGGGGGGALGGGPAGGGPGGPGCSTGAGGGTSGGGGGAELISRTKAAGPMKAFIIRRDSKPRPMRLTTCGARSLLSANGKSGFTRRSVASAPASKSSFSKNSLAFRMVVTLPPAPTSNRTTLKGEDFLSLANSFTCSVQVLKRAS
mmetsp:Transcript_75986/g.167712  ORF Transcript_75986/g.167712 Transcript_75986/m.167712 type:complete len:223 (+) Transcript_75986:29-697(+)